ncbi:MAG TPA: putative glycolipid-binding domain-containing protein [Miltoncostaeaceae bacterium]|nr:putative glycolipid-binding domain-containing protein [Miltoncostaeaceae bacterium]
MDGVPSVAAWRHIDAREAFEVAFLSPSPSGLRIDGHTAAVEEGRPFAARYAIQLDRGWRTIRAHLWGRSPDGPQERRLEADGRGGWRVDGAPAPALDGLLDVDLEASALTNAFPVRRLAPAVGDAIDAPAVYVRALDLAVERLEQRYERLPDAPGDGERYAYAAPRFGTSCALTYAPDGLVADYPGLAERVL